MEDVNKDKIENQDKPFSKKPVEVILDHIYCPTCKERKLDSQLLKQPLDYRKQEDGSAKTDATRYTVFCAKCQTMLTIIDPEAAAALDKILKNKPR